MKAPPPEPGSFLKRTVDQEMIQYTINFTLKAGNSMIFSTMRCANITTDSRTFSSPPQKPCPHHQSLGRFWCPVSPASESSISSNIYSESFRAGILCPFYEEEANAKSPRSLRRVE